MLPKILDDHFSLVKHYVYGLDFANIRSFLTFGICNFAWIYLTFFKNTKERCGGAAH
jgi:hypothetical protein